VLKPLNKATTCLKARGKHGSFRAIYKVILVFEYIIRACEAILRTYDYVDFNAYPKALEDYLINNPHYFDPGYMGTDFVTELVEMYHSNAGFYIIHQSDLAIFLRSDTFEGMCIPANHVRRLVVRLSLDAFDLDTGRWTTRQDQKTMPKSIYVSEVAKLKVLEGDRLQQGSRVKIRVISESVRQSRLYEEALVPVVYSLRRQGWYVEVSSSSKSTHIFKYNYNILEEDWETKIAEKSTFVSRPRLQFAQKVFANPQKDEEPAEK
jgi:hypothetical protein